jgi:tetratricopeptide (TPR) repeat protein
MATVYEAVNPLMDRALALKAILPELATSPDLLERFMREAQAAGGLQHRNIVTVYDLGEDDGLPYIVMELVPGTDLEKVIQAKLPYSVEWKLDVVRQICDGLGFAHENGIVHRDVKPANVRVTPEDEVKILDFGIARLRSSDLTQKGLVLGTLQYMSPEQAEGQSVDHRSDIFSVGVIAYELLALRKPFVGDTLTEVMHKLTHEPADPEGLPKTDYSPGLEAIVLKALATDPQDRYQTLAAMRQDLEQLVRDVAPRLMARGKSGSSAEPAEAEETATPEPEPDPDAFDADTAELNGDLEEARSSGHLAKAWAICEKLLERRPNDPELMKTAEGLQAQIQDEEVAQLGSTALAYAEEGETELADKILGRIWAIAPDSPRLDELRGVLDNRRSRRAAEDLTASAGDHLVQGNLEEALAAVEEALEQDPSNEAAQQIRERTARVLSSQHSRSLIAGDEASEAVTAASGDEPAANGPVEAAEAEAPPTETATDVGTAASPSEPPAVASEPEPEAPDVGHGEELEETSELPAQSAEAAQAAEPAADSGPSDAPSRPHHERGKVEGLMSKALSHFLRNENAEARAVAERVLALDPGHRRAQELIELLASLK